MIHRRHYIMNELKLLHHEPLQVDDSINMDDP